MARLIWCFFPTALGLMTIHASAISALRRAEPSRLIRACVASRILRRPRVVRCLATMVASIHTKRGVAVLESAVLAAVLSLVVVPSNGFCQATPHGVRGIVLSSDSSPAKDAWVELIEEKRSARTTATGSFFFENVRTGRHTLRLRALGHLPKSQEIEVSPETGWADTVFLQRAPQELAELQVIASGEPAEFANTSKYDDFFRRRKIGQGTFRTRDDIDRFGALDIASVLQAIPGANVSMTGNPNGELEMRFRLARCPGSPPNIVIYIDGLKVFTRSASENRGSELSGLTSNKRIDQSTCADCVRRSTDNRPVLEHPVRRVLQGSGTDSKRSRSWRRVRRDRHLDAITG